MKRITVLIICICLAVMMFAGCAKSETKPASDTPTANAPVSASKKEGDEGVDSKEKFVEFAAQYIRTDGYIDGEKYPKIVWITSVSEIEEYYNANKDKYYLESIENPYSDQTIGFQDAVKKYNDSFFEDHDLLFVILEEGSGSIRHEVTGVKMVPTQDNHLSLQPEIDIITPECGTDDMAEWHIMIELSKENGKSAVESVTPVLTARMLTDPETEGEPR